VEREYRCPRCGNGPVVGSTMLRRNIEQTAEDHLVKYLIIWV